MINDPAFARMHIERITGLDAYVSRARSFWVIVAPDFGEGRMVLAIDSHLGAAVNLFLAANLRDAAHVLHRKQHGKCLWCGRTIDVVPPDHIEMRSHGRDDRIENLRALCRDCHEERHRPPPHPRLAAGFAAEESE